jgi:hypothetical protein
MITVPRSAKASENRRIFEGFTRKIAALKRETKMGLRETRTVEAATLVRERDAIQVPKWSARARPEATQSHKSPREMPCLFFIKGTKSMAAAAAIL